MTREEEIKQAAKRMANQCKNQSDWNYTYYGFIEGAKWADKTKNYRMHKNTKPKVDVFHTISWGGDVTVTTITEKHNRKQEFITKGNHIIRYSTDNYRNYDRR